MKQKGRSEKLQATLCKKDKEINELKAKIVSLETHASFTEQENNYLKLAFKLIMQEKSVGKGNSKSDNSQSNERALIKTNGKLLDQKNRKKKQNTKKEDH